MYDTNKTITVTGQNLQDELNANKVSISGSGVTSSVSTPGASDATMAYWISTGASTSTGARQFTKSNSFGTSNAETFTVVDPLPNLTGVSPRTWDAGSSYTVTITGINFGTNPAVSIALPSGTIQPTTSNPSDTSVTARFTAPADSPSETAAVAVTSTGFSGSGFFPGNSGNSPLSSNNSANVEAETPHLPQIDLLNGTASSPFAGQLRSLFVLAPSGWTLNSESWSFGNPAASSPADGIANHIANQTWGAMVPVSSSAQTICGAPVSAFSTTQTTLPNFYYVIPGRSETVNVSVTYEMQYWDHNQNINKPNHQWRGKWPQCQRV